MGHYVDHKSVIFGLEVRNEVINKLQTQQQLIDFYMKYSSELVLVGSCVLCTLFYLSFYVQSAANSVSSRSDSKKTSCKQVVYFINVEANVL